MSSWLEESTTGCAAASVTVSAAPSLPLSPSPLVAVYASGLIFTMPSDPPVASAERSAVVAMSQMTPSCSPTQVSVSSHGHQRVRLPPVQKCSLRPAATARVLLDKGMLL